MDYHLFRQEITSKYPSYNPPPPLVPIELNNKSILPPLPNHPSRNISHDNIHSISGAKGNGGGKSIFHQPVHIATPAPSPPPSPAGPGGKGGKKQNYQTNQNFPFLYPPLDGTSNDLGGKGNAGLQDKLVGKRWEGSDVPASILEAGELFSSRMRMSRSLHQMWEVREEYVKSERGWEDSQKKEPHKDEEIELAKEGIEKNDMGGNGSKDRNKQRQQIPKNDLEKETVRELEEDVLKETDDDELQCRLNAVEGYYVRSHQLFGVSSQANASSEERFTSSSVYCYCVAEGDSL